MKRLILMILISVATASSADPVISLAIAEIQSDEKTITPPFLTSSAPLIKDSTALAEIREQLPLYSQKVREQIATLPNLKLLSLPHDLASQYLLSGINPSNESTMMAPAVTSHMIESGTIPNFLLIGKVAAVDAGEVLTPLMNSNKFSNIYTIDLAVNYQLIRIQDQHIIATFTAAGHSGEVHLVNAATPSLPHNYPLLLQQLGTELSMEVSTQFSTLIMAGKLNLSAESEFLTKK